MTMKNELLNSLLPHLEGNFKFNIKNPPVIGIQAVFYDRVNSFGFVTNKRNGKEKLFLVLKYGHEPYLRESRVDLSKYDSVDVIKYKEEKTKYKILIRIPLTSNN
jgi:hypothetical protein